MKIGIVSYVHGWYVDYLPTFIYSVKKAYPHYTIKIFLREQLPDGLREKCNDAIIVEDYFKNRAKQEEPGKVPYYLRFLIPYEQLEEFDRVFICDIDLLMVKEDPSLDKQLDSIMRQTGLPFANYLRNKKESWPERFTGWHYIDVKRYFHKTKQAIKSIDPSFDITQIPHYSYYDGFGNKRYGQEALLHKIIMDSFDFDPESVRQSILNFPTHHGLHLGPLRGRIHEKFYSGDPVAIQHFGLNAKYWTPKSVLEIAKDEQLISIIESLPDGNAKTVLVRFISYFNADFRR